MKISKKEFLILQINDSLFPIGSYSHSYGLETYIQKGIVHDEKTAERYLRMKLRYSFMYTDLLAVKLSYEAATKGDIYKLEELEDIMEASRIPEEIRCASRKLGSRFVKTLFCMDPSWKQGIFEKYVSIRTGKTICHPCAYGIGGCNELCENDSLKSVVRTEDSFFTCSSVRGNFGTDKRDGRGHVVSFCAGI